MNIEKDNYWIEFYENVENLKEEPSSFSKFCLGFIDISPRRVLLDIGCGNARDLNFFRANGVYAFGVDSASKGENIITEDICNYIKKYDCCEYHYMRFFWHSIEDQTQIEILDWIKSGYLFIEARTEKDCPENLYGRHKRNLVNVEKLIQNVIERGFEVLYFTQGFGMSPLNGEDPHLCRMVARKI